MGKLPFYIGCWLYSGPLVGMSPCHTRQNLHDSGAVAGPVYASLITCCWSQANSNMPCAREEMTGS